MRFRPLLSILTLATLTLTLATESASAGCGLFGRVFHRRAARVACAPSGYGYSVHAYSYGGGCYSGGYATMGGCYGGYSGGYAYEPPPPIYSTPCPTGQGGPSPQCTTGLCPNPPVPGKTFPPVPGKTPGQPTPGPGQHVDCPCGDPACSHTFGQCGCNNPKCVCHPDRPPGPGGVTPPAAPIAPVTPEPVVPNRPHHGRR